jgi:sporulation protein YlmC with PRC-barrel domain
VTSLRETVGRPAILRDTAEQAGEIKAFAIDAPTRRVVALVLSAGRSARIVDWSEVRSIGPDAVIVDGSREPRDEDERTLAGAAHPLDKRLLSDKGNEIGQVADATVDDDGVVLDLRSGEEVVTGDRLLGVGSYAVVVAAAAGEG